MLHLLRSSIGMPNAKEGRISIISRQGQVIMTMALQHSTCYVTAVNAVTRKRRHTVTLTPVTVTSVPVTSVSVGNVTVSSVKLCSDN